MNKYLTLPRTVHVLCVGILINRAGTLLVPFLTLYLQSRMGLGIETATRILGAYGAGALVAALVGGQLADHFGRKRVMVGSLAGGAAVLALFPLLQDVYKRQIYDMAREGKSAQEILAFIGESARRRFDRHLANALMNLGAVSYTHLDVYKRQSLTSGKAQIGPRRMP